MHRSYWTIFVALVAGPVLAQPAPKPKGVTPAVRSLSFSPDGTRLAAAVGLPGGGGRVIVWDVAGRKRVTASDKAGDRPNGM